MSTNSTTRELIEEFIDLENEREYLELEGSPTEETDALLEVKRNEIKSKTEAIDSFSLEVNRQTGLIDGEIKVVREELNRLMMRKKAIKRTEEYFKKVLLPMIIETLGNDGVFKTDTAKYKLYKTWGPIEVIDEDSIPDAYKRVKIEIDKKGARKAVIEAAEQNMGIAGFSIEKVKRVRKT
jgi:hypothetical protein